MVNGILRGLVASVLLLALLSPAPAAAESAKVRRGVKQLASRQYKSAMKSFREALKADPGDADAMARIGDLHAAGLGVPRSDAEAVKWYLKAAPIGNAAARYALGIFLARDPARIGEAEEQWRAALASRPDPALEAQLLEALARVGARADVRPVP